VNKQNAPKTDVEKDGLGFSLDSLADVGLVRSNFKGKPKVSVESLALAARRVGGGQGSAASSAR
jgi:hypothetical protein